MNPKLFTFFIVFFVPLITAEAQSELGEGFFSPNTTEAETLYLFDIPNSRAGSQERPTDSITFIKRYANHVDGIGYAPQNLLHFTKN